MSNATMTTNNNTIEQPFSFEQTEQNGLITTTLSISNPTQETINSVQTFLVSGGIIDDLIISMPLFSLPDLPDNFFSNWSPPPLITNNTRRNEFWLDGVYHPIDKKFIDEGDNYCICIITLESIKKHDKYIVCETCQKCFSIEVKDSWVNTHNNCPHCRSQWQDYTIYINADEKKITTKIKKFSYKSQKLCGKMRDKKWQFKNKFYKMMKHQKKYR